ncbi:hypothetical protein MRS44_003890 [Fusarium solani]|uniref:uncharacterized protein n=1 Tax=Fusarium solani TaxID=169388 RepID=UPI0032C4AAD2|nr:hypothetical protein MRS44_003890 [Fusarium solani]
MARSLKHSASTVGPRIHGKAERDSRNQEYAGKSYRIPTSSDFSTDPKPSGLPWGSFNIAHFVAQRQEANSRRSGGRGTYSGSDGFAKTAKEIAAVMERQGGLLEAMSAWLRGIQCLASAGNETAPDESFTNPPSPPRYGDTRPNTPTRYETVAHPTQEAIASAQPSKDKPAEPSRTGIASDSNESSPNESSTQLDNRTSCGTAQTRRQGVGYCLRRKRVQSGGVAKNKKRVTSWYTRVSSVGDGTNLGQPKNLATADHSKFSFLKGCDQRALDVESSGVELTADSVVESIVWRAEDETLEYTFSHARE